MANNTQAETSPQQGPHLSPWQGWDQSNLPWSEAKHKDAVCQALFGPTWSMEDAETLIGFIDRTWGNEAGDSGSTA